MAFGWISLKRCFPLSSPELCRGWKQPDDNAQRTEGLCHHEEQREGRRRGAPQILLLKGAASSLKQTARFSDPNFTPGSRPHLRRVRSLWSCRSSAPRSRSRSSLSAPLKANCTISWRARTRWFSRTAWPTLGRRTPYKVRIEFEFELNAPSTDKKKKTRETLPKKFARYIQQKLNNCKWGGGMEKAEAESCSCLSSTVCKITWDIGNAKTLNKNKICFTLFLIIPQFNDSPPLKIIKYFGFQYLKNKK